MMKDAAVQYARATALLNKAGYGRAYRAKTIYDHEKAGLLVDLKFREFRTLKGDRTKRILTEAARRNDFDFFKQLGRTLAKAAIPTATLLDLLSKTEKFVFDHWAEERDGVPALCKYDPASQERIIEHFLRFKSATTADALTKLRQRLKLPSSPGRKLHWHKLDKFQYRAQSKPD